MPTLPPVVWRAGAAIAAGIALATSFPPYDAPATLPLGVALLTLAARGARVRVGALCGLLGGLAFFLILLRWLSVVGIDAWLLVAVASAAFFAVLGAATTLVTRLAWWPLWVACVWVAQEAVRDRVPFGGFPWGRLAFGDPHFLFTRWAALGGAPLVTFLTALSGALLAWAAVTLRRRPVLAVAGLALAVAVPALSTLVPTPTAGREVTVALVQGNVPRLGLDFLGQRRAVLDNHVQATLRLAAEVRAGKVPAPQLVIWPENSSDIDPFVDVRAREQINMAAAAVGVPMLVGLVVNTANRKNVLNAGYVWDPRTGPGARYVKRHLVPFGEYVPFRSLLAGRVSELSRIGKDFLPGTRPGVLQVGPARVGDVICFEVAYDGIVRDAVRGGGQAIVVQTNNATYGGTAQPAQQALMSRERAVEHGRPVLVASTSGISEFVSANGTVTQETRQFVQQVLVQRVALRSSLTVADQVGDLPEIALTIVALAAVAYAAARRRSRTGRTGSEHE